MKILKYLPLILAALMYGVATYLLLFVYLQYNIYEAFTYETLWQIFGSVASYMYLSGSILVVGFFISDAIKRK